ncbi:MULTISPECIES: TadG family pilus assembly protein [Paraburkholderia]|uniref:Putative Tad-like Flp pilus-assembly n=1 Tax=Paraburkholderia terricola TaxID=169427 RepID=A0A1M6MP14_9BURK|nr:MULTISPECIES: TadG family pilus assembly protein [Paraburkholderia]SDO06342.1 Putative Tad-like Flp pilus-assembly [Paraburkholderia sediminicola]SHJ85228.1 Putative Tad-like Flp pilus-assembly [Paraburkholderia terricola]
MTAPMLAEREELRLKHDVVNTRWVGTRARYRRQRGTMSFVFVSFVLMALAFSAFSVDIGRYYLASSELQTAADAAAIAGARSLFTGNLNSTANWSAANASAASAVQLNASGGSTLTAATVQSGFWNLTGSPASMQSAAITPGAYDSPGVQVTVSRATGLNGGSLVFLFAPLFGVNDTPVTATAVAVVSAPGFVATGALYPVALAKCIFDQYWNTQTGSPKIDPSTGQAYTFQITNGTSYGGCLPGQWTSFQTNANDVPTVRGFMANGNPAQLSIGASIWIQPGVKTTIYSSVLPNIDVLLPVVQQVATSNATILGFAAFHIDSAVSAGGNNYIQGHLITRVNVSSGSPQNSLYGAYVAPRLAR